MEVLLQQEGRNQEDTYKGFGGGSLQRSKGDEERHGQERRGAWRQNGRRRRRAPNTKREAKTEGRGRVARHRNLRRAEQCAVTVAMQEANDTNTVIVVREATNTTCQLHGTRLAMSIEDVAKSSIPRGR